MTRIVIGTIGETMVSVPPRAPMAPTETARQTPSVIRNAAKVDTER